MAGFTKSERTAARIVSSASELFFAQGFSDTTIAQVAELADVATGTVMLHFGSKSELGTAVFSSEVGQLVAKATRVLEAKRSGVVGDDLATFVRPLFAWYRKHGDIAPALLREALFSEGDGAVDYAATVDVTVKALASIVAPHLDDPDTALLGEGLLADYLLTLLQGFRGDYRSVAVQVEHFVALAMTRIPTTP